jgi:hypothetical protein
MGNTENNLILGYSLLECLKIAKKTSAIGDDLARTPESPLSGLSQETPDHACPHSNIPSQQPKPQSRLDSPAIHQYAIFLAYQSITGDSME